MANSLGGRVRLEDLSPHPHVLVKRYAKLRIEVHDASDHQEHGLHLCERPASDDPLLYCGRDRGLRVRSDLRSIQMAYAHHCCPTAVRGNCLCHFVR